MGAKYIQVLEFPSSLLTLIMQHPNTGRIKFATTTALYTISFSVLFTMVFVQFPLTVGDTTMFVENFEAFGFFTQTCGKLIICAIKRKDLLRLLKATQKFWSTDKCSDNVKETLENILSQTNRAQKMFLSSLLVTLLMVEVHPFFNKQFPLGIWVIQGYDSFYYVILGIQEVLIPFLVLHAAAFDSMFLGFCLSTIVQFKILKTKMKELSTANISNKAEEEHYINNLTSCIKQHMFLLRFLQDMRDMYSPTMLVEYSSLVLVFCAEMFILFESRDFSMLATHITIMLSVFIQLAFYCLPVDYVASEASEVCGAIFESDWHSTHLPILRSTIPFIIQRSQKNIVFTAGGMYDMNSRTLVAVLKVAYSVCVAIRATR